MYYEMYYEMRISLVKNEDVKSVTLYINKDILIEVRKLLWKED